MRKKALAGLIILSFLLVLTGLMGCAKNVYFGVKSKALWVPSEFAQTEAAVEKAERSPGAQYAPEKITKARELGKNAVETYWGCRTKEAMDMLDEVRKLAREAEVAKAPPKPKPATVVAAPAKVAPAPAVPKPVAVPPKLKKVIILKGVNFGFNFAELTPQARTVLDEQTAILKKEPDIKVEIAGHTDSIGPEEYNKALSEKRATVVKKYLILKGINPDRLKVVGYGESRPIDTNWTTEGRAENRRVELNILKK